MKEIAQLVTLNDDELKTIVGGEETDPTLSAYIQKIPLQDGWKG